MGAVLNRMRASSVDWEAAATTLCAENDVEDSRLDIERIQALAPAARSEFCLSSAIVGGIAAQEIIKFVTGRGKPMENQFYFDALDPKCENELRVCLVGGGGGEGGPACRPACRPAAVLVVPRSAMWWPRVRYELTSLVALCDVVYTDPGIVHNNVPQPVGEAAPSAATAGPSADQDVLIL